MNSKDHNHILPPTHRSKSFIHSHRITHRAVSYNKAYLAFVFFFTIVPIKARFMVSSRIDLTLNDVSLVSALETTMVVRVSMNAHCNPRENFIIPLKINNCKLILEYFYASLYRCKNSTKLFALTHSTFLHRFYSETMRLK